MKEMPNKRTVVVGDVHGSGKELQLLLANEVRLTDSDELILVGDLFNRAERPDLVWKIIQQYNPTCLLGNHENKLRKFLRHEKDFVPAHYIWMLQHLIETTRVCKQKELLEFLEAMPILIERASYLIAHAGIDVRNPSTPNVSANVYGNLIEGRKNDKWWEFYNGSQKVVYGHTSTSDYKPRYCQNRCGQINSIGIDTACATGGFLTAYCLETEEVWQHRATMNHFAVLKAEIARNPPHYNP